MMDLPGWAVRGAKVVCIEGEDWASARAAAVDPAGLLTYPRFQRICTLRAVRIRYVSECENPIANGGSSTGEEPCWDIRGFAPVVMGRARTEASRPELVS